MLRLNLLSKTCSQCSISKSARKYSYHSRGKYYRVAWCKQCQATYQREYRPEWYAANREKANASSRESQRKARNKVIEAYGGKCTCCGEPRNHFLSLEHVNGGGRKHRQSLGNKQLWFYILKEGCPKDKYTILCFNCNLARGFYGYCCTAPKTT